MPRPLDAREYKILLDAASVGTGDADAEDFLAVAVRPQVAEFLDGAEGSVGLRHRAIHFLDTPALALDRAGLSLRFRAEAGKPDEYTLKLRMADRFVAAAADIAASGKGKGKDKFEEDIAPLEVVSPAGVLTIADPPDIRSRFSLSVTEPAPGRLARLGDALDLFPNLDEVLWQAGTANVEAPLREGPQIAERVFQGPKLTFGRGVEARLALTLWTMAEPALHVAEISFRCALEDDHMPGPPARAALRLFRRLQRNLALDLSHASKTRLALPRRA